MVENSVPTLPVSIDGPRKVQRRPGRGNVKGSMTIARFVQMIVGVLIAAITIHVTLVDIAGVNVPGTIVSRDAYHAGRSNTLTYRLYYMYQVGGIGYLSKWIVKQDAWNKYPPGSPVTVHVLPSTPHWDAIPMTEPDAASRYAGKWWIYSLLWAALIVYFNRRFSFSGTKAKQLIESGHAVVGEITNKPVQSAQKTTFLVEYRFQPDVSVFAGTPDIEQSGKLVVPYNLFTLVNVGDRVTVLYDRAKPNLSAVYELSDYEVVP